MAARIQTTDAAVQTDETYQQLTEAALLFGAATGELYTQLRQTTRLAIRTLETLQVVERSLAHETNAYNEMVDQYENDLDGLEAQYIRHYDEREAQHIRHREEMEAAYDHRYNEMADRMVFLGIDERQARYELETLRNTCPVRVMTRVAKWVHDGRIFLRNNKKRIINTFVATGVAASAYLAHQAT